MRITIEVPDSVVYAFEETGRAPETWSATAVSEAIRVAIRHSAREARPIETFDLWYCHPRTGARHVAFTGSAIDVARKLVALGLNSPRNPAAEEIAADLESGNLFGAQDYIAARTGASLPR